MSKKFNPILIHLILLLSLLSISTITSAQKTAKIIGGTIANTQTWPWMTGLVAKNISPNIGLFCGASLIAENWVLTAAHCVFDESTTTFDVIINQANFDSPKSERISVEQIILHPLFPKDFASGDIPFNDLALLKLSKPSINTPVKLASSHSFQDNAGKQGRALGWGTLSFPEENFPSELYQVDVPIIGNAECVMKMGDFISQNMLCAGFSLGEKGICDGDSGGPLIVFDNESNAWRQVGITSLTLGCAQRNAFDVYTRLEKFASFISENICSASEIPDPVSLTLSVDDKTVTARWSTSTKATGYRLYYAPNPTKKPFSSLTIAELSALSVFSVDMNELTEFSIELSSGRSFLVAILANNGNCLSGFSNIGDFEIK
jgi:secreted trypsin-like serine protease